MLPILISFPKPITFPVSIISNQLFFEDLAGFAAVGGSDYAVLLHHVDDPGGPGITETHFSLEVGDGSNTGAEDELYGVVVKRVCGGGESFGLELFVHDGFEDVVLVFGAVPASEVLDDAGDFLFADVGAVHA